MDSVFSIEKINYICRGITFNVIMTENKICEEKTRPGVRPVLVVGVGGCGVKAVTYIHNLKLEQVRCAVCNNDEDSLDKSPVADKILLDDNLGTVPAKELPVRELLIAESNIKAIKALVDNETQLVFVIAGMGGITGTLGAPIVAEALKECGVFTIGIITLPFYFEGQNRVLKAVKGAEKMMMHIDALMPLNNESLMEKYKDLTFVEAFGKSDEMIADVVKEIADIVSGQCYVNVDMNDVTKTLEGGGAAVVLSGEGEGDNRIRKAIDNALASPLTSNFDINRTQRLLLMFACSRHSDNPVAAAEMMEITDFIGKLPNDVSVSWGIGDDSSLGDKVRLTILAK